MAGHVFLMYVLARTWQETFGNSISVVMLSLLFAGVMLIPLLWAIAIPDLPLTFMRSAARRRWIRGQCPECRYPASESSARVCPECGAAITEPEPYQFRWSLVRRFVILAIAAWVLGAVAGEAWVVADEASFRREIAMIRNMPVDRNGRDRRWPGIGSLDWMPDTGFAATRSRATVYASGGVGTSTP